MITIKAKKIDGSIHRMCDADLMLSNEQGCVIYTRFGTSVTDGVNLLYEQDADVRAFFVYGARLNLLEICEQDHSLREIYLNVTAPQPRLNDALEYIDLELDVSKLIGADAKAKIVDQDEFQEASELYGYTTELIEDCHNAAKLGLKIAEAWQPGREDSAALDAFIELLMTPQLS